jgi:hypothetical protein
MQPHIQLVDKPLGNSSEYYNGSKNPIPVFMVTVGEKELSILYSVEWLNPRVNNPEFKILKCNGLWLGEKDKDALYPPLANGAISTDTTIVQELFSESLDPYGIVLNSIVVHAMDFFESQDFTFTDPAKEAELHALISEYCKKMKHQ